MISDEGSGHWVGVQAVASVVRSAAQGNESQLVSRLLAHWGLKSVDDLVRLANASPPPDFAGLFPVVRALDDRDPLASEILEHAGTELAQLAAEVYRSLWTSGDVVDLALTGGVAQNSARVRDAFQRQIQAREVKARVRLAEFDPAEGALAIARKLAFRNA
jgi:N-acetylglucosamine kinase-like BadF-type ATPase